MLVYTLDNILDRQMNKEQIEVLEELLTAIRKIDNTDVEEAFKVEAPNHHVFDVCYKEDTSNLITRVEEAFPNLEGCINQLSCEDYITDHDTYDSIEDEQEAKDELIAKINAWKESVDLFIENVGDMY